MSSQLPEPPHSDSTVLTAQEVRERYRTVRTGIRVLGLMAVSYFGFHALQDMAGQNTSISIALSLIFSAFADFKFLLALGLVGLLAAWAVAERYLRHRKVEFLQGRIKALETTIDPQRTSSQLTIEGKTNPRDRGD